MIKDFIGQDKHLEMFITGPAGSGKTTNLADTIAILDEMKVVYQVVAYTHKAKEVLISKLPAETPISTLHSWLKKRPGVNEKAKHLRTLVTSKQYGKPEHLELLIVDEFSFVGEKDYWSIGELQDEILLEESVTETSISCAKCGSVEITERQCDKCASLDIEEVDVIVGNIPKPIKVLYIGDPNQLSPVDGVSAVIPEDPFWTKLTTIYRQDAPGLKEPLAKLVQMIEGNIPIKYLEPTEALIRKCDIDEEFKALNSSSKIMLSYTNKAVQVHNMKIQGYEFPKENDVVYNSSLREDLTWEKVVELEDHMELMTPQGVITKDSKYNPFRELRKNKHITYVQSGLFVYPVIFGFYSNKIQRQNLGTALTEANKSGSDSKKAYKAYKVVNDFVSVVDFKHCQTVHKSQGQEFDYVFVDTKDLAICRDKIEMVKLLYVAMSRAKIKIFLNN